MHFADEIEKIRSGCDVALGVSLRRILRRYSVCRNSAGTILVQGTIRARYIEHVVDHYKGSGTGPDGLPPSAWRSPSGKAVLSDINREICSTGDAPPEFNDQRMTFLPNGFEVADLVDVVREPQKLVVLG